MTEVVPFAMVGLWAVLSVWTWGGKVRQKVRLNTRFHDPRSRRELEGAVTGLAVALASVVAAFAVVVSGNPWLWAVVPLGASAAGGLRARA